MEILCADNERVIILSTAECGFLNDNLAWLIGNDMKQLDNIKYSAAGYYARLRDRSGVPDSRIRQAVNGGLALRPEEYEALAACFGLTLEQMLEKPDEVDEAQDASDLDGAEEQAVRYAILDEAAVGMQDSGVSLRPILQKIAEAWSSYLQMPVREEDVALMMALRLIIAAPRGGWSRKTLSDIIAYTAIAGEAAEERKETEHAVRTDDKL